MAPSWARSTLLPPLLVMLLGLGLMAWQSRQTQTLDSAAVPEPTTRWIGQKTSNREGLTVMEVH